MYQNDFILREIERLTQVIASIIFDRDLDTFEVFDEDGNFSAEGFLLYRLRNMVCAGQINEAENLLFAEIELAHNPLLLSVAVSFYQELTTCSPEFLASSNYTAEEIAEGLQEVRNLYEEGTKRQ